ncbi:MAG: cell division protein ZapA [Pseudomonadota bacterium]|nr:cell division protein ZapA [Pseudomonadota bacterium]|tara:strand:+ start:125 stop:454 length:330 start_codon:yes stop_codon:yes gene_type:complete
MAQVDVLINGKSYNVGCDDGQEDHLLQLAGYVDQRIQDLVNSVGQVGDARLLVMASLLISDELSEIYAKKTKNNNIESTSQLLVEQKLVKVINDLAQRIEEIADTLDPA